VGGLARALSALTALCAATALAQEPQAQGDAAITTEGGTTRVIIGAGLGGASGAKYKVNGQSVSFKDRFQGSTDDTAIVAVKVATFGIALRPGLYAGLDLTGIAKAGNVPRPGAPATFDKTAIQITDYFAALTYFPWESGVFLKGGAGISTFGLRVESDTTHSSGLGFLLGAGYALQLTGSHHITASVEQTWQSYGGSSTTKPGSSQFASFFLGYLYKN
jgi:hypothetical protein